MSSYVFIGFELIIVLFQHGYCILSLWHVICEAVKNFISHLFSEFLTSIKVRSPQVLREFQKVADPQPKLLWVVLIRSVDQFIEIIFAARHNVFRYVICRLLVHLEVLRAAHSATVVSCLMRSITGNIPFDGR